MFVVTVTFIVAEDRLEEFLPLIHDNARKSLSEEPGCHRFDVCQHIDRPNEIFLYEIYESAAGFDIHVAMQHFLEFSEAVEPMVRRKSVHLYELLDN